jgi:hypothetical protein
MGKKLDVPDKINLGAWEHGNMETWKHKQAKNNPLIRKKTWGA